MKKGFTLIELLVVVLIIGILSSVALPQYTKAVEKSRAAEMLSFVASAKKAVALWILQNGDVPSARTELLKEGLLDIEASSSLDCEGSVAGTCGSKNYSYSIFCETKRCEIQFYRNNGDTNDYYKGYVSTSDGSNWEGYCGYESALGKPVCDMFATMGNNVTVEEL